LREFIQYLCVCLLVRSRTVNGRCDEDEVACKKGYCLTWLMRLCTVLVKDEELVSDLMYDRQKLLLTIATLYPGYTIQPVVKLV